MNNPILSICIPTYNRSNYLEDTLISIVKQKCFVETNSVEIVISDNCSTDNTQEIGEKYAELYEGKIRYFRNAENIRDLNFEKVLTYGHGEYLKLNNDTLNHVDGSLDCILETIQSAIEKKEVLFFSNASLKESPVCYCHNLDEFVQKVSYLVTWIGGFGIWKSDFDLIDDFSKSSKLQLTQVDVMLSLVASAESVLVDNRPLFVSIELKTKGGYNILEVFVRNYFDIIEKYVKNGEISKKTLSKEKKKVMKYFLMPWLLKIIFEKDKYTFSTKGAFGILLKKFGTHYFFYVALFRFVKSCIHLYNMALAKVFRVNIAKFLLVVFPPSKAVLHAKNRNEIYTIWKSKSIGKVGENPCFCFPLHLYGGDKIEIGNNFSCGPRLRLETFFGIEGKNVITIGNNVSINYDCHIGASNSIIIGNNVLIGSKVLITDHSHGEITSHSFNTPPALRPIVSKGPVIIEDNVWIGEGVAILPGVTLGANCIIGANSVVTRSIPANSVACGNPARVVKVIE